LKIFHRRAASKFCLETFFSEKRPFFIEGSTIFNFGQGGSRNNNNRTRGGPLTLNPAGWQANFFINSDSRKTWVFGLGTFSYSRSPKNWERGIDACLEWKPGANLSVSAGPTLWMNRNFAQYVTVINDPLATATFGSRYIFAELKQTELKSLRGNAVLRWEYSPGSTLYFVWTQSRSDYENLGDFRFHRSLDRLVDARPDNIFLVKATYWWGL
jgi:hypothetical protein